jgi:hypothetical protein
VVRLRSKVRRLRVVSAWSEDTRSRGFVRDTNSFASYQGKYFYTDYCGGWIRGFAPSSGTHSAFASGIVKPVDLEVGDNGSLYYLYRGSSSVPPAVHEIR